MGSERESAPEPKASEARERAAAPSRPAAGGLLGRALADGVPLSNRGVTRLLAREDDGGYGYEFSDDPLAAGGFGPNDATIRIRPGPVRTTLIRPKLTDPKPGPARDWLENALKKDPVLKALPDWARDKAIDALKDIDETAAEKILDAVPFDDKYKEAAKAAMKALLQSLKGKKWEAPQTSPYTRVPEWQNLPSGPAVPGEKIFWGPTWRW